MLFASKFRRFSKNALGLAMDACDLRQSHGLASPDRSITTNDVVQFTISGGLDRDFSSCIEPLDMVFSAAWAATIASCASSGVNARAPVG